LVLCSVAGLAKAARFRHFRRSRQFPHITPSARRLAHSKTLRVRRAFGAARQRLGVRRSSAAFLWRMIAQRFYAGCSIAQMIEVPSGTAGKCGGRPQGPFVPDGAWFGLNREPRVETVDYFQWQ